ncbi:hypothetical protein FY034_00685 [Trichlorobacter lovleyi]|nr:hypothetical protein FY034_00685 [Trichlorobacter lovleyi]
MARLRNGADRTAAGKTRLITAVETVTLIFPHKTADPVDQTFTHTDLMNDDR